jgi:hypothetical protein
LHLTSLFCLHFCNTAIDKSVQHTVHLCCLIGLPQQPDKYRARNAAGIVLIHPLHRILCPERGSHSTILQEPLSLLSSALSYTPTQYFSFHCVASDHPMAAFIPNAALFGSLKDQVVVITGTLIAFDNNLSDDLRRIDWYRRCNRQASC